MSVGLSGRSSSAPFSAVLSVTSTCSLGFKRSEKRAAPDASVRATVRPSTFTGRFAPLSARTPTTTVRSAGGQLAWNCGGLDPAVSLRSAIVSGALGDEYSAGHFTASST